MRGAARRSAGAASGLVAARNWQSIPTSVSSILPPQKRVSASHLPVARIGVALPFGT